MIEKPQPHQMLPNQSVLAKKFYDDQQIKITYSNEAAKKFILDNCSDFGILHSFGEGAYLLLVSDAYKQEDVVKYINSYNNSDPDLLYKRISIYGNDKRHLYIIPSEDARDFFVKEAAQFGKLTLVDDFPMYSLYLNAVYDRTEVIEYLKSCGDGGVSRPQPQKRILVSHVKDKRIFICAVKDAQTKLFNEANKFGTLLTNGTDWDYVLHVRGQFNPVGVFNYLKVLWEYDDDKAPTVGMSVRITDMESGRILGEIEFFPEKF